MLRSRYDLDYERAKNSIMTSRAILITKQRVFFVSIKIPQCHRLTSSISRSSKATKMPSNGITISVTAETNAGGRRHMEDYIAVNLSPNDDLKEIPELREQAFVGVFDGHGGKEAAKYAREALWQEIQKQPKFRSQDVDSVSEAIKEAYLALHNEMVSYRRKCTT